jgi:hypothetical protein
MFGSHHVFGERHAPLFICQERSSFHSYRSPSILLFLLLGLACIFRLDLCSDLVISFHQGVFLPLIYIGFHQKEVFIKSLNGVRKEKKLYAKKWYKKELV